MGKSLIALSIFIVITAIVAGLFLVDGPGAERRYRLDGQRIKDLDLLAAAVDCYWTLHDRLPKTLDELAARMAVSTASKPLPRLCRYARSFDPETEMSYRYRAVDARRFDLCAEFAVSTRNRRARTSRPKPGFTRRAWQHDKGAHCFQLTAAKVKIQ